MASQPEITGAESSQNSLTGMQGNEQEVCDGDVGLGDLLDGGDGSCFFGSTGTAPAPGSNRVEADSFTNLLNEAVPQNIYGKWEKGTIKGSILHWRDSGEQTTINASNPTEFTMTLHSETFRATVQTDGNLRWSDGDVWYRLTNEAMPGSSVQTDQPRDGGLLKSTAIYVACVAFVLAVGIGFVTGRVTSMPGGPFFFNHTERRISLRPDIPGAASTTPTADMAATPNNMTARRDSCCWKMTCLNFFDDKNGCEPNAQGLTTSYHRLWEGDAQMKASFREDLDRIVASEDFGASEVIQQAIDAGGYDCHEGDKEQPQSEQLKADVEFMKKYADDRKSHLIQDDVWVKSSEAFELVLGNALATYPPLKDVINRYVMAFVNHNGVAAPTQKPAEFAKNYEGACFAGFTPHFNATFSHSELKNWVTKANSRELLTKFYARVGDYFSTSDWQNSADKQMCHGYEVKERILDHRGIHPRFRMPYKEVGLGWMNVQLGFFPGRGRLIGGWDNTVKNLKKYNVKFKWPRRDTMDPELSHDEEVRMQTCPTSEEVLNLKPRRVPWIAGRFGLFLQEDSPVWLMSQLTGLPVRSGVSGSTLIMLSSAETMHFPVEELHLLRLALMGWMIPAQDHSMLEVMMGAMQYIKGRSFPLWYGSNATDKPTKIQDWKRIHRNLLPEKFNWQGVTLTKLNMHIDKYIRNFNQKHGTSVEWPHKSTSANPWWTHEVFDYVTDDLAPQQKKLPKEIAPDFQCDQTTDKKNNYACSLLPMKESSIENRDDL